MPNMGNLSVFTVYWTVVYTSSGSSAKHQHLSHTTHNQFATTHSELFGQTPSTTMGRRSGATRHVDRKPDPVHSHLYFPQHL